MSKLGITAHALQARSNRAQANFIIDEQIKIIDARILSEHQLGRDNFAYQLPIGFDIGTMDPVDAQLYIYSEIIKKYKAKGFTITIGLSHNKTTICIRWINGLTDNERAECRKIISDACS